MRPVELPAEPPHWPLLGADGPVAVVSGRVAYRLGRLLMTELRRARDQGEALDPELVATIYAIEAAGLAYVDRVTGTEVPPADAEESLAAPLHATPSSRHDTLTVSEVATRLGCSERNVRALATRGALAGRRDGRSWLFDHVDVEEYAASRRPA